MLEISSSLQYLPLLPSSKVGVLVHAGVQIRGFIIIIGQNKNLYNTLPSQINNLPFESEQPSYLSTSFISRKSFPKNFVFLRLNPRLTTVVYLTSECMLAHAFAWSKTTKFFENYEKNTFFIMHTRGLQRKTKIKVCWSAIGIDSQKLVDAQKLVVHLEFCFFLLFLYFFLHGRSKCMIQKKSK